MKTNFKFLAIILSLGLFLQSCSKDDDSTFNAITISNFEYGEGSTHSTDQIAQKESKIHIEANINAENKVKSITVSIHSHEVTPGAGEEKWNFNQTFTDIKYLVINPTFHEHITVPDNIPEGEYHIELLVEDEQGNTKEVEGHIDILGVITLDEFSIDASVVRGNEIHVEFHTKSVHGIHSITADIHAHGLTPEEGEVEWDEEIDFTDYHEETDIDFHEHIPVPNTAPAGEYHIIFTIEDEEGNIKEYEDHVDITKPALVEL